jgi:hypothetical protein
VFGVALFPNHYPIFPTSLQLPSVGNAVMTDFIAMLGVFRFAINSSLILTELKLAPLWKISSTWKKSLVILESQVAIVQHFECQTITEKKMDMNINKQAHGRWFLRKKSIEIFQNDNKLARRL